MLIALLLCVCGFLLFFFNWGYIYVYDMSGHVTVLVSGDVVFVPIVNVKKGSVWVFLSHELSVFLFVISNAS